MLRSCGVQPVRMGESNSSSHSPFESVRQGTHRIASAHIRPATPTASQHACKRRRSSTDIHKARQSVPCSRYCTRCRRHRQAGRRIRCHPSTQRRRRDWSWRRGRAHLVLSRPAQAGAASRCWVALAMVRAYAQRTHACLKRRTHAYLKRRCSPHLVGTHLRGLAALHRRLWQAPRCASRCCDLEGHHHASICMQVDVAVEGPHTCGSSRSSSRNQFLAHITQVACMCAVQQQGWLHAPGLSALNLMAA